MAKFTMYDETLHTLKEQFNECQAQVILRYSLKKF